MQAAAAAENLHKADERELQAKLKELVRHIRESKLRITFTDALGQAAAAEGDGVSSQKEARRLAFYLFWNIRASYDRCDWTFSLLSISPVCCKQRNHCGQHHAHLLRCRGFMPKNGGTRKNA